MIMHILFSFMKSMEMKYPLFSYPVIHECTEMKLKQWMLNRSPEGRKYEISHALVQCNDNNQTQWNGEQD